MSDPTIQVLPKGPYLVVGKVTLLDASGNNIQAGEKIALCRCGASTNKPFCDGTHSKIGFDAAAAAVRKARNDSVGTAAWPYPRPTTKSRPRGRPAVLLGRRSAEFQAARLCAESRMRYRSR